MPYTPHTWIAGDALNATRLNNMDGPQYTESTLSFNPDLLTAYVVSGLVCTKDGSVANQLDVTSGKAYLLQADGTTRQRVTSASIAGQFTTSTINTTYHLYLQPDGSFYWNTANSPAANSLAIANVTTDGSGNILAVTDARNLNTTLLPNMIGLPSLPGGLQLGGGLVFSGGASTPTMPALLYNAAAHLVDIDTPQSGANSQEFAFVTWDGAASRVPFGIGTNNPAPALTSISHLGVIQKVAGQATAGSFGVPVVVAQTINQHITSTTLQTVLTYTPAVTGLYRVSGCITVNNGTPGGATVRATFGYQDPNTGTAGGNFFYSAPFSGSTMLVFNAAPSISNSTYSLGAQMFYAQASNAITVTYTDSTNTPNDFISVLVERIS